ncbi:Hypothetical_protein [Hexamita inflata]|uniref:Hypothetical_protein n=1 Tax=Hexamita inflata TaxID=28002 RepID=A0AA86U8H2_9EUKA|nr:Hypothetical protein HINF_LOCUS34995 [Hexamita inflata]
MLRKRILLSNLPKVLGQLCGSVCSQNSNQTDDFIQLDPLQTIRTRIMENNSLIESQMNRVIKLNGHIELQFRNLNTLKQNTNGIKLFLKQHKDNKKQHKVFKLWW